MGEDDLRRRVAGPAGVAAVMLLGVLPHASSLSATPTLDDASFISRNASIQSIPAALGAFASPFPAGDPARGLYRPLTNLSYAIDHAISGGAAWSHHLGNLVLYALTCALVLRLARRCLPDAPVAAFAAAALFALHPVHCEAVDSATGRSEILALFFALLALDRFFAGRPGMVAACAAAMLSKETGAVTPALLALAALVTPGERLVRVLPTFALLPIYLALRATALGGFLPATTVLGDAPRASHLYTIGTIYLENLRLMVWPSTLQVDFYYQVAVGVSHAASARAIAGIVLGLATIGAFVVAVLRARSSAVAGVVALGLGTWLLFLGPTSHVVPFGALMAERFLYAPSVGLVLVLGVAMARVPPRVAPLGLAVAVALAARTSARALDWQDGVRLWTSAAAAVEDPRVLANLADAAVREGDEGVAEEAIRGALALDPLNAGAWRARATLHWRRGEHAASEAVLRRLTELEPKNALNWNNLGAVLEEQGRLAEARECFRRAVALDPNYTAGLRNLSRTESE